MILFCFIKIKQMIKLIIVKDKISEFGLFPNKVKIDEKDFNFGADYNLFTNKNYQDFFRENNLRSLHSRNIIQHIAQNDVLYELIDDHWKYIIEAMLSNKYTEIIPVLIWIKKDFYKAITDKEYYFWNESQKLWNLETSKKMKVLRTPIILEEVINSLIFILKRTKDNNINHPQALDMLREINKINSQLGNLLNKLSSKYQLITSAFMDAILDPSFENLLDSENYELPILDNKIIDLRNGNIRDRTINDYWTKEVKIKWNPEADMTFIQNWINELFLVNVDEKFKEVPEFLQKVLGYGISGSVEEQAMFIFHSEESSGKSALNNFLENILGDFYTAFPSSMLTKDKKSKEFSSVVPLPNPFLAHLDRKRIAFCTEGNYNTILRLGELKELTSKDKISYRLLFDNRIKSMKPSFKIFLMCNEIPFIKNLNQSVWRRIYIINFPTVLTNDLDMNDKTTRSIKRDFERKLNENKEAMLRWLVEGSIKYFEKEDLEKCVPEVLLYDKNKYKGEFDFVEKFISDAIHITKNVNDRIESSVLYNTYLKWQKINDDAVEYGNIIFGKIMAKRNRKINSDPKSSFDDNPNEWLIIRANGTKHVGIKIKNFE
jgi:P4 family phage/plasmid primase-like protien